MTSGDRPVAPRASRPLHGWSRHDWSQPGVGGAVGRPRSSGRRVGALGAFGDRRAGHHRAVPPGRCRAASRRSRCAVPALRPPCAAGLPRRARRRRRCTSPGSTAAGPAWSARPTADSTSCIDQWSPWPFVAVGAAAAPVLGWPCWSTSPAGRCRAASDGVSRGGRVGTSHVDSTTVTAYLDHAATTPMLPEALEAMTEQSAVVGNASSLHTSGRARAARRRGVARADRAPRSAPGRPRSSSPPAAPSPTTSPSRAPGSPAATPTRARDRRARQRHRAPRRARPASSASPGPRGPRSPGSSPTAAAASPSTACARRSRRPGGVAAGRASCGPTTRSARCSRSPSSPRSRTSTASRSTPTPCRPSASCRCDFAASGADLMTVTAPQDRRPARRRRPRWPAATPPLVPAAHGGGQERQVRSGTLDAPGIRALRRRRSSETVGARATSRPSAVDGAARPAHRGRAGARAWASTVSGCWTAGDGTRRLPGNAHLVVPGLRGRLPALPARRRRGRVLAPGRPARRACRSRATCCWRWALPEAEARGALRLSLGHTSTEADVDAFLAALPAVVERARARREAVASDAGRRRDVAAGSTPPSPPPGCSTPATRSSACTSRCRAARRHAARVGAAAAAPSRTPATPAASPTCSASRSTSGTSRAASSATSSRTSSPSTPPAARPTRACAATSGSSSPALLDKAVALGFDAVATGHYAQVVEGADGRRELHRAVDAAKDQSLRARRARRRPAGPRRSSRSATRPSREVREEAAARGFSVAKKPDSHDICFIPDGDTRGWLTRRLGERPGDSSTPAGAVVGAHAGAYGFTVGQRRGLGLDRSALDGEPRYVVSVDAPTNRVVIGTADLLGVDARRGPPPALVRAGARRATCGVGAQVRAHGEEVPATADGRRRGCRAGRARRAGARRRPRPVGRALRGHPGRRVGDHQRHRPRLSARRAPASGRLSRRAGWCRARPSGRRPPRRC